MIKCPTCGSENEAEAVFCGNCGTSLSQVGTDTEVVPGAPKPAPEPKPEAEPKP